MTADILEMPGSQPVQPADMPSKDGIYPGISRAVYERIERANYSFIKKFIKTPAHAKEAMTHPYEPTPYMDRGTAGHTAILEPERFLSEYVQAPKVDRRTKIGKETWADFEEDNRGKTLLAEEEMEAVKAMTTNVYEHEIAKGLLSAPGKNEMAVLWTDKITGLGCKALVDRLCLYADWTCVVDIKTCRDAGHYAFGKQVAQLLYHEQAAFYLEGLNALAPLYRRFLWLLVENERPHCVAVRQPDPDMLLEGKKLFRRHLEELARCRDTNLWPGYPATIETMTLPRWAFNDDAA